MADTITPLTQAAAAAESKAAAKETKKRPATEYVILRLADPALDDDRELWEAGTTAHGHNAAEAIRAGSAGKEGVYVAVPASSFRPVKVKVETTTRLHLENA